MRWAPLGPTPGSRPSSSMRSWTTPSYTDLRSREAEAEPGAAEPLGQRPHGRLLQLGRRCVGVADRGNDQVGQALGVFRVAGGRGDGQPDDLTGTGDRRGDEAAAR